MSDYLGNKSSAPTVTVIIPTYNHAQFLKKALTSVLAQTFTDWEAIVVNNFSSDNTIEVVESFRDERIKLLNFNNNGSIGAARNQGINKARGKYIAFLDSDDYWFPDKLERCIKILQEEKFDLVCNSESLIENDKVIATWNHGPGYKSSFIQLLMLGNCLSTSAVTVKKECLDNVGGFREDKIFNTSEDYDLWIRLIRNGHKCKFLWTVLGGHLKHAANNSSAAIKHLNSAIAVVESHLKEVNNIYLRAFISQISFANMYYGAARQLARQGNHLEALTFFKKSLKKNPFRIKTYMAIVLMKIQKV